MYVLKGGRDRRRPTDPREKVTRGSFFMRGGAVLLLMSLTPGIAEAQGHQGHDPEVGQARRWSAGAQLVPVVTRVSPAMAGETYTEGYLTQPAVWGRVAHGTVAMHGMLNLEGLTLERGELNPGIWGEGYFDRRHPHTYLHELVATASLIRGSISGSLSFGRGFAPFGTDDPMARPLVKYPANHHLAQVLERTALIGAARWRGVVVEGGIFNGDEPTSPTSLPSLERFGDSRAARITLVPSPRLEVQGSYAFVASPEFPSGSGLDHRKRSVSLRHDSPGEAGSGRYLLMEWARTDEYNLEIRSFSFSTLLAEGALDLGAMRVAARLERTSRPEEERIPDSPFRTVRPHGDANLLGITRWNLVTVRIYRPGEPRRGIGVEPFLEITRGRATPLRTPTAWDPTQVYGSDRVWSISAGASLRAGPAHGRMGRYGVAAANSAEHPH